MATFVTALTAIMPQLLANLSTTLPQTGLSNPCLDYIVGFIDRASSMNYSDADKEMLYYSGKYFGELGLYKDCITKPNMTYYNVQLGVELIRQVVGICFTDQCNDNDWDEVQKALHKYLMDQIIAPGSGVEPMAPYFVLNVDKVYPREPPGLNDSYTLAFFVLFFGMLALVLYSTFHYFLKSRSKGRKSMEIQIQQEEAMDSLPGDQFEIERKKLLSRNLLRLFDIKSNLSDAAHYTLRHPGQLTVDLVRIVYSCFIAAYSTAFVEAMISKISQDKVENDYYNSGPADSNLQIILFLPEGFLFLTGYAGSLAAIRAFSRINLGAKKQNWWKIPICYFQLILKRFLRLMIGLMIASLFIWKFMPMIVKGPLRYTQLGCTNENFFSTILLWNNTFGGENKRMCHIFYYYLAMDFWMYLTLPAIVVVYLFLSKKLAGAVALGLGVASFVYLIIYLHHHQIREVHPYDGRWLVHVLADIFMHGLGFYLGMVCCFLQLPFIDGVDDPLSMTEDRPGSYFNMAAGKELSAREKSFHQFGEEEEVQKQPPEASRRSRINRFWEITGILNLLLFSASYYIYMNYLQNDSVNIQAWPQWKHTLFNSVGIFTIAVCPIFIIATICFRVGRPLLTFFSKNIYFGMLRSAYYETFICTMPFLLTIYFALQAVVYFDEPFVNSNIVWMTVAIVVVGVIIHYTITKPYLNLFTKVIHV